MSGREEKWLELALYYIVELVIAYYLFVQAPLYNKDRWLWAILGFFFGIITLSIFLIQTNRKMLGWLLLIVSVIIGILGILFLYVLIWAIFFSKG